MSIYNQIIEAYPELTITPEQDVFSEGKLIRLQDDGDGLAYIAKWDYEKPIPAGLKLGKD